MGRKVDFEDSFLSYITKDSNATELHDNYSITIHAFPPDVNIDALTRPHTTILSLQCATEKPQELIITSFPVRKTFNWSPRACENVIFKIEVGDKTLTKKYTGDLAFPEFITDFKYGVHKFSPNDFPDEKSWLEWKGIEYILVKYRFTGQRPVLELLQSYSVQIPKKITKCWD
jgi:type VI secretion system protein ImpL